MLWLLIFIDDFRKTRYNKTRTKQGERMMIIPNKLKKGDTIGVIATSSPITEKKMVDIKKSQELMESAGFQVQFSKNFFSNELGYSATSKKKKEDIHEMFSNPEIKAIFFATGGANCNMILDLVDYDLIKRNPKILCGFSDSTSILNMIHEKTGLVTFHGPTFKSLTSWETDYGYQEVMDKFVKGKLALKREQDIFTTLQEGMAEGELIGGNLSLITRLVAGKYSISFQNKILFMEELGYESDPEMVSGNLYYLKQNGVFDQIKGLWIGNYEHQSNIRLEKIVEDVLEGEYTFPIIKSNNFGHVDEKNIIPIGTKARINTTKEEKIIVLENCVK